MPKKKSINDIIDQRTRLYNALVKSPRNRRIPATGWSTQQVRQMYEGKSPFAKMSERISKSSDTYVNNILRSKQFQDAFKPRYEGESYQEREERAYNTKMPRNVYMGLVNG